MRSTIRSMLVLFAVLLVGHVAQAQDPQAMPADYAEPAAPDQAGSAPPIPPFVEGSAVQAAGGGYCFAGPHPVDSSVVPGVTWDSTAGQHVHPYPPFDLRLFSLQNGCYYFIGDPTDFGYAGSTYSYYGAHPILGAYGGGWCFMIGPHRHFWRPWSPLFVTVGPWFYWQGPYDPFFWTYWPYYHFYYRSHYPHYYSRGAFFRGHAVAPRITSVPRPPHYGGPMRGGYRGAGMAPRVGGPGPGMNRGAPMMRGPAAGQGPGMYRPGPGAQRGPAVGGGFTPRNFAPPASRGYSAPVPRGGAPFGGGHFGGGSVGGGHFGGGRIGGGSVGGGHFGGGRIGGGSVGGGHFGGGRGRR
jgi:hypothetical protein